MLYILMMMYVALYPTHCKRQGLMNNENPEIIFRCVEEQKGFKMSLGIMFCFITFIQALFRDVELL
jgi:hypothetical protein